MSRPFFGTLLFFFILVPAGAAALSGLPAPASLSVTLETRLAPETVRVGESAQLTLELRYGRELGEIAPQLEPPEGVLEGVEITRRWTRTGAWREGEAAGAVREFGLQLRATRPGVARVPAFTVSYLDREGPARLQSSPVALTVLEARASRQAPWEWIVIALCVAGLAALVALLVRGRRLARQAGQAVLTEATTEAEELRRLRQLCISGEGAAFFSACRRLADRHLERVLGAAPQGEALVRLAAPDRENLRNLYAACESGKFNPAARGPEQMEAALARLVAILALPVPPGGNRTVTTTQKEHRT